MSDPNTGPTALEAYIRENRATVTEAALRSAAIAAGHAPADVDAAIAATRNSAVPRVDRGRLVWNVFLAYLAVFLILSALIAINTQNVTSGFLGDLRGIGIVVLGIALVAGFVASLIWIGSPRAFWFIAGILIVIYGASITLSSSIIGIAAVAIGGGLVFAAAKLGRGDPAGQPSRELLLLMPILILIAVGGSCVLTGLPIPRGG